MLPTKVGVPQQLMGGNFDGQEKSRIRTKNQCQDASIRYSVALPPPLATIVRPVQFCAIQPPVPPVAQNNFRP
jgi:hypothetical protein